MATMDCGTNDESQDKPVMIKTGLQEPDTIMATADYDTNGASNPLMESDADNNHGKTPHSLLFIIALFHLHLTCNISN